MSAINILSIAPGSPNSKTSQWLRIRTIAGALNTNFNLNFNCIVPRKVKAPITEANLNGNLKYNLIPLTDPKLLLQLVKYDKKPNLVYFNTHFPGIFSPIFRLKKIPIMFDMHGVAFFEQLDLHRHYQRYRIFVDGPPNFLLEQMAIKSADSILCVSKEQMSYLHKAKKISMDKLHFITNGVDLNYFHQQPSQDVQALKKKLGIDNEFIFGYIGALQVWQGATNFFKAAKSFDKSNVKFLIVGGNKSWKSQNIIKIKKVPFSEVPLYYSICDVLVLPRPYNLVTAVAAPTKFAEYTAMGKPVLVTNVGDVPSFVKKYHCGEIAKNNNPKELMTGFSNFLKYTTNDMKELGRNSRKLAETIFDWKIITGKLSDLIRERYSP